MSADKFRPREPYRTFEDLSLGERRKSRSRTVTQEEILEFARSFDPQWFHTDPESAKHSVFGQVVASGIHVLALWRQLDHEINWDIDFVCGVGWDELRLKRAIRAGDTIHVTSEIVSLEPSRSRADRGTARTRYAVVLEDGTEAVTFTSINLVYTRDGRQRMVGTAQ
ncbi:MaoC/PaaZ C-terminal domain-containing protein [Novosphingobium sp. PP1Y]|uniref:MaoC/PaaZ C-terminal domain-containing protein n=1 Tax=Novosphingobium sp. PP1Y TaxID=702113 RepID=UPI00020EFC75|nr:MaoC/PaaZ C-terminal domain-containing protein [Novosphingobium sp. PP1Y]CCA90470.1 dehydratase [Novosphingobium sp. PP1Y]